MMGVAFTKSLWEATGGFPTEYGPAGDVAWQIVAGLGPMLYICPRHLQPGVLTIEVQPH